MPGRQKIFDTDREEIKRLHDEEGLSYSAIAVRYGVDYRTISRVCNPQKYEEEKKRNIEYSKKNRPKILTARKTNQRKYYLTLTRATEGDMIRFLDAKENLNQYLKSLIAKDMAEADRPAKTE